MTLIKCVARSRSLTPSCIGFRANVALSPPHSFFLLNTLSNHYFTHPFTPDNMRWLTLFTASLLAVVLPMVAVADHGHSQAKRHTALARRARGDVAIHKRQSFTNGSGQLTWYAVGLGACGWWNNPPDMIVAISHVYFNGQYPDPHCGKSITISYQGKTVQVTVADECMGCNDNHIDGSQGVFENFADLGVGEIALDWWFDDDAPAPPPAPSPTSSKAPPPPPPPTSTEHTTSTPPPPPPSTTSTWSSTQSSTSTSTWTSTSTHSNTTSTSHSTTTTHSTTSSTHTSTSTSATPTPTGPNVLADANQAFLGMAAIVAAGGSDAN